MRTRIFAEHPRRRRGDRRRGHRFFRTLVFLAALGALAWFLLPPALSAYARWLIVDDPVGTSDAVVALAGGNGERLGAAIQLYRRGAARELFITGPDVPFLPVYTDGDSLTQGEMKRRIAVRKGVPAEAITMSLGPTSTLEEAQRTRATAQERGWKSILVVTDPFHTRRSRATFRHVFRDSGIAIAMYHLPIGRSSDNPERWWKRESDQMGVLTETIKLSFYAWNHRISPWE